MPKITTNTPVKPGKYIAKPKAPKKYKIKPWQRLV